MVSVWPGNYLPSACRGCVVVHRSHPAIWGIFPVPEKEAQKEEFHWDPDSKVFSVVNAKPYPAFTYLTFLQSVVDRHGARFEPGLTRSDGGKEELATTFVVVADPRTAVRLGALEGPPTRGFFAIELERLQSAPQAPPPQEPFGFPLPDEKGPYLCTQGVGGHLTHFFPESYHAIDLRCANHTPVLSIGAGVVKEICQSHKTFLRCFLESEKVWRHPCSEFGQVELHLGAPLLRSHRGLFARHAGLCASAGGRPRAVRPSPRGVRRHRLRARAAPACGGASLRRPGGPLRACALWRLRLCPRGRQLLHLHWRSASATQRRHLADLPRRRRSQHLQIAATLATPGAAEALPTVQSKQ
ncbi:Hypothetical protein SCF082_LOCUS17806 [Durusdinium trenchii]|uniref:Uncharacterized protein n=1 Tax=Durusdinium trenchii TaxID=1381693 RepID=A0ABP0KK46_9DINO